MTPCNHADTFYNKRGLFVICSPVRVDVLVSTETRSIPMLKKYLSHRTVIYLLLYIYILENKKEKSKRKKTLVS